MNKMENKTMIETFKLIKCDEDALRLCSNNPNVMVNLDNDDSFVTFSDESLIAEHGVIYQFSENFGWSEGVIKLFKLLNIKADLV